jgi:hypothetical protein
MMLTHVIFECSYIFNTVHILGGFFLSAVSRFYINSEIKFYLGLSRLRLGTSLVFIL